jgi:hypothetical protein
MVLGKLRTLESCIEAVEKNINDLVRVPEEFLVPEVYEKILKKHPLMFKRLLFQPRHLVKFMMRSHPTYLCNVFEQDEEICMDVLVSNPSLIRLVNVQTERLVSYVLGRDPSLLGLIHYQNSYLYEPFPYIPLICPWNLVSAVQQYGPGVIRSVLLDNLTTEMCEQFVEINGEYVKYLPPQAITESVAWRALQNSTSAIKWIPNPTMHYLKSAFQRSPNLIAAVYDPIWTDRFIAEILETCPGVYPFLPRERWTANLHMIACMRSYRNVAYAKANLNGFEICVRVAFTVSSSDVIGWIPREFRTKEFYLRVVERWPQFILFAPLHDIDDEIRIAALRVKPHLITSMHPDEINIAIELAALEQRPDLIDQIPAPEPLPPRSFSEDLSSESEAEA